MIKKYILWLDDPMLIGQSKNHMGFILPGFYGVHWRGYHKTSPKVWEALTGAGLAFDYTTKGVKYDVIIEEGVQHKVFNPLATLTQLLSGAKAKAEGDPPAFIELSLNQIKELQALPEYRLLLQQDERFNEDG